MIITARRTFKGPNSTGSIVSVDGKHFGFFVEDTSREMKIPGVTCIWPRAYTVGVRTFGGFHRKYSQRFDFHRGMLEIIDVPHFTDILIHCGNKHEETLGCPLTGMGIVENTAGDFVTINSTDAYVRLYQHVIDAALAGKLSIDFVEAK